MSGRNTEFPLSPKRDAWLLGAGFSRAASSAMPLTDELGREALEELRRQRPNLSFAAPQFSAAGLTFEAWLTWLAERQPYEDEPEAYAQLAVFTATQAAIAEVLRRRETSASTDLAAWFDAFIDLAHHAQTPIITLNYDTLVEQGLYQRGYRDEREFLQPMDAVVGFPNGRGMFMAVPQGFVRHPTLRVYKLHGSTDWHYFPGDTSGATLDRIEVGPGRAMEDLVPVIGGRSPFIVPPTSSKSRYFDNPKTRFIWREARRELEQADRVVLIGYSLPLTDTNLASLLARTLSESKSEVLIVNPEASEVARRLEALGVDSSRIMTLDGITCVAEFVEQESEEVSRRLAASLAESYQQRLNSPVAVGWPYPGAYSAVEGYEVREHSLTFRVAGFGPLRTLARPGAVLPEGQEFSVAMTLGDLPSPDPTKSLRATDGQTTWTLAGYVAQLNDVELGTSRVAYQHQADDDWIVLRPVGRAPA
ncbi:hypothetical protein E3O44_05955 [Cryobacterium algoricola]|uniref:SIR2-like domain-containing protein n=1 Tax=Cryobacterium algoricola TaxID=1259183 RepID=A0ABY2IHU5_9MICO|nr:SIR2 family protein [Cryobacterium algoricola]TFB88216.1 hypothetical protein E3O44_05955 [Cryobacterium algoricola]